MSDRAPFDDALLLHRPTSLTRRRFLQAAGLAGTGLAWSSPAGAAKRPVDRLHSLGSAFAVDFGDGAITGLRYAADTIDTRYVAEGDRLGDVRVRFREGTGPWRDLDTGDPSVRRAVDSSPDGRDHAMTASPDGAGGPEVEVRYQVEDEALRWRVTVRNPTDRALEVGDLALPLPIHLNREREPVPKGEEIQVCFGNSRWVTSPVLRHGLVCGAGSFFIWMRGNSVGPFLMLTTDRDTKLEYFEESGGYRVYIHSAAAGAVAAEHGCNWRQPNTGLELEPGAERTYGLTFRWANDYEDARRIRIEEGQIDVEVVPGMTVPTELPVRVALRTTETLHRVEAEYPDETEVRSLGRQGDAHLYEVRFGRLGENRLTVHFGDDRRSYLEFFTTEAIETLIAKRGAFLASHQWRVPRASYDGLLAEWAMDTHVMLSPDQPDRIEGWRTYHLTANDGGLGKPAFLAAKNAEFPVQEEVEALDYYIENFLWGGLQQTTEEAWPYGIYRSPDKRTSQVPGRVGRQHLWRLSDYSHIALLYLGLYRVARYHPHIETAMDAKAYLQRAYGTALATFTIPWEIERWSAYYTGLKNGLVVGEVIEALYDEEMLDQAERLRPHWERKARTMVMERPDLFLSEYAFGCIGFEGSHALAKIALGMAEPGPVPERDVRVGWVDYPPPDKIPLEDALDFMEVQMAGNIFARGWLETSYYLLGVAYGPKYMAPMGGLSVIDYALYHAEDPFPYLRLGYAGYLSMWAQMNTGTPESNYGYWFPGPENDGGAGGDFEMEPYGETWLGQPHSRGIWFYSGEADLGFCGALRCARTVLADDPLFGRVVYGGEWSQPSRGAIAVTPRDGLRRRFHAVLDAGRLHLESVMARFSADRPIVVSEDLRRIELTLEADNPDDHSARLRLSGPPPGTWELRQEGEPARRFAVADGYESVIEVPVAGRRGSGSVSLMRVGA